MSLAALDGVGGLLALERAWQPETVRPPLPKPQINFVGHGVLTWGSGGTQGDTVRLFEVEMQVLPHRRMFLFFFS